MKRRQSLVFTEGRNMGVLKSKLKNWFPGAYEYYLHIQRRKCILEIERRKNLAIEEYQDEISKQYKDRIGPGSYTHLDVYKRQLQDYMLEHKMISRGSYCMNILKRWVVQVALPNSVRGWVFRTFARSKR